VPTDSLRQGGWTGTQGSPQTSIPIPGAATPRTEKPPPPEGGSGIFGEHQSPNQGKDLNNPDLGN
jgi:hypothetical protein